MQPSETYVMAAFGDARLGEPSSGDVGLVPMDGVVPQPVDGFGVDVRKPEDGWPPGGEAAEPGA